MATYYFRGAGTNLWNTATNWSTSSNGAANGAVPTAVDDVIFDSFSNSCSLATTAGVCKTINFTNFNKSFSFSAVNLIVSSSVILSPSMSITASAVSNGLNTIGPTCSLSSNGTIWPGRLTLGANTLNILSGSDFRILGSIAIASNTGTLNSFSTERLDTKLGMSLGNVVLTGSATIVVSGGGSSISNGATGLINLPIVINTTGSVTMGLVRSSAMTLTLTNGIVTHTSDFYIQNGNVTLATQGMTLNTISYTSAATMSLVNQLSASSIAPATLAQVNNFYVTGSGGFSIGTLNIPHISNSISLSPATYSINSSLTLASSPFGYSTIRSNGATPAYINLSSAATQNLGYVTASNIDASAGQTLYIFKGYLTGSNTNVISISAPNTVVSTF